MSEALKRRGLSISPAGFHRVLKHTHKFGVRPTRPCGLSLVNPDRNEDTHKTGRIWYAQVAAGDRMMPVRMEFDTAFGAVRGYLAELRGRGAKLNLVAK